MSEECTHNCESCTADCGSRGEQLDFSLAVNKHSNVKKVIGIVSGKGGVGKSLVTALLAVLCRRGAYNTAVLDADITGPSIPALFNVHEKALSDGEEILPAESKTGIKLMSLNLLLPNETDPVVWRGPAIAGVVGQFWTDVRWGDVDFMFVDMPPGTGDVPLTVFQSLPVDGIIVVTSPQQLVGMIVQKAVNMAELMNIPVLALVENMSGFVCPECGKRYDVFGVSRADELASEIGVNCVARVPVDPRIAAACDAGAVELFDGDWLDGVFNKLTQLLSE